MTDSEYIFLSWPWLSAAWCDLRRRGGRCAALLFFGALLSPPALSERSHRSFVVAVRWGAVRRLFASRQKCPLKGRNVPTGLKQHRPIIGPVFKAMEISHDDCRKESNLIGLG